MQMEQAIIDNLKIQLKRKTELPEGKELLLYLNNMLLITGRVDVMFCNSFVQESLQLLVNSILLYEDGFFDCAFYSLRQASEVIDAMLYLANSDDVELKKWRKKERFPMDSKIREQLKKVDVGYGEISIILKGYFEHHRELIRKTHKIIHKQGTFVTDEEYPKFVRQELIVNAVTHRAYSITGTDIQIKMFDDHMVVESPGKLPGLVRADNIRFTHFSRNPKIAEFLKNYKFVKEFGEGVNRMCNELESVGLKDPVYYTNAFMLQAVIYNTNVGKTGFLDEKLAIESHAYNEPTKNNILRVYEVIESNQIFGAPDIESILKCSTSTAKNVMKKLKEMEVVEVVKGKGKGKYVFKSTIG